MAWSKAAAILLTEAFEKSDLAEFQRLLQDYPENLRYEDGTQEWLTRSAHEGMLEFAKLVVELGIDVNEPAYSDAPEGVVRMAAANGHLEVVRWLLENGAKINFTVDGQTRCFALTGAAAGGHLEIVKLLVEHGADIHASWAGMNALFHAKVYGTEEVADYLESLGVELDWDDEPTPPDYPASHRRLRKIFREERGELSRWKREIPGDPPVMLACTNPSDDWNSQTLFTVGLSDRNLTLPDGEEITTELMLMLPPDWPLTKKALADPLLNWPVEWMMRIVRDALDGNTWPDADEALFLNGNPPQPLAANTRLCGWLCVPRREADSQMPDDRWVEFRSLFPIYEEEHELIVEQGAGALLVRFHENNLPLYVDPDRDNVAD